MLAAIGTEWGKTLKNAPAGAGGAVNPFLTAGV